MNPLRRSCLVLLLTLSPAVFAAADPAPQAPAPKQSVPNPFTPRFKQVRERIESLYRHRNEPPAPPDPRTNPFRTPGSTLMAPVGGGRGSVPVPEAAPSPEPSSNLSVLQQAVATLKVSGVFEIGGQSHLVINARPYKEGDVVKTLVSGEAVYLRVREISNRSVTLVLNDTEMTLKF